MASLDDFGLLEIDSSWAQTRPKSANHQIEMVRYRFLLKSISKNSFILKV
jgi:hypothetical protein